MNKVIYFYSVFTLNKKVFKGIILHTISSKLGKKYFVVKPDNEDEPIIVYENQILTKNDYILWEKLQNKKMELEKLQEEINNMERG